ncbi:ABC transporter substrate-binding protein [Marinobacter sp. MDS2]|uniref:substrate-binding periplasmic protein n=1 Tax=Marinobacter sp. MDS2 TaxID=3065961 RepID=UPI00273C80E8|nr:transporter substrate-binding domain-containing protein [Marinobacter sp. MDS2]MDP4546658.1 transporter substrate-binding domain-containing protein [Marinobacter sp. MDS2]
MLTTNYFYACLLAALLINPADSNAELPDRVQIAAIYDEPTTAAGAAILKRAYQRLGVDASVLITPSRRALMMADTGLLDGDLFRIGRVAQLFPNLIRVEHVLFRGTLRAVVRKDETHVLALPPPQSMTVAIRRGIIISELTARNMGVTPVYANSNSQALSLLQSKRVDAAFFTVISQFNPIAPQDLTGLNVVEKPLAAFDLYHYLNRRHWELANALPDVLRQMEQEGVIEKVLESFRERQGEWETD